MSLTAGARLGPYEITGLLGAGGMGEVYRARDSRLGREVALKVLPAAFANDAEYMARFQREAQVLASLNHPNIAIIHGLEETPEGLRALAMELVDGPTLEERIQQGALPSDEAIRIARQIGEALEAAHDKGIIHRDLKPANIKLTADGRVKVLDFGLAKSIERAEAASAANSPTLTIHSTRAGVILGTAAYMSPEQARGNPVDRRTDIWAFGVILLEMLTGRTEFAGETVSDTLAAVLRADIGFDKLPSGAPRRLVEKCLQRDPKLRLKDIGDAWLLLESGQPATLRSEANWVRFVIVGMVAAVLGGAAVWYSKPKPAQEVVEFSITSPDPTIRFESPTVSPDGRQIALLGRGSKLMIWVRSLDRAELRPVPETEWATNPFAWSPDSRQIVFVAEGKIKKVDLATHVVETLVDIGMNRFGNMSLLWASDGSIVYSHRGSSLMRIAAGGGAPAALAAKVDGGKVRLAAVLPDGKHFLYNALEPSTQTVYCGSMEGSAPTAVVADSFVLGLAKQHLLVFKKGQIFLQPFDEKDCRATGSPVVLYGGGPELSANAALRLGSMNGSTLAITKPRSVVSQLEWRGRNGNHPETVVAPGVYFHFDMSRDGSSALLLRPEGSSMDIWHVDLRTKAMRRVTFGENVETPMFAPDGNRFIYSVRSRNDESSKLVLRPLNSTGAPETLLESKQPVRASGFSSDGKWLSYVVGGRGMWDLYLLPLQGERKPVPFVTTVADEYQAQFSPDGHWIAYTSSESGRYEVYVAGLPGTQGKWQISTTGGQQPHWRADGKELFYITGTGEVMSVTIDSTPTTFRSTSAVLLFKTNITPIGPPNWMHVTQDGKRFLVMNPNIGDAVPVTVIRNWEQLAERK